MKQVVLTTDLYHRHADPNDHWNLAIMYALAHKGYIKFAGIMCDDDRAQTGDGSMLHFGDPSVESIAQLNYLTGLAVPVGFGSRKPIKKEEDLKEVLNSGKKISSVTLLHDILKTADDKVDIHMCGSCKDVLIAYYLYPELFKEKVDSIYLNAGTYAKQEPIEYNVSLEPYAYSKIFDIPVNIKWAPCFDELRPYPYIPAKRANYFEINQWEFLPILSEPLKKYFNYMYGHITSEGWLTYLRSPLDEELLNDWAYGKQKLVQHSIKGKRQMWSCPGYLLSAGKKVTENGKIVDASSGENSVFTYRPVSVKVKSDGYTEWKDTDKSNVYMFENISPEKYFAAMNEAVKTCFSWLKDLNV